MLNRIGTLLFIVGLGVSGTYAARNAEPQLESDRQPTWDERISAWGEVAGVGFGVGVFCLFAGGLIVRRERAIAATALPAEGVGLGGTTETPSALLASMEEVLGDLPIEAAEKDPDILQERLDLVLESLVPKFIGQKDRMISDIGLGAFAEMIGDFSTMERNVARAWSALIDEVPAEIPPCIERAQDALRRARTAFDAAQAKA